MIFCVFCSVLALLLQDASVEQRFIEPAEDPGGKCKEVFALTALRKLNAQ